jgi:hypothetical protein
METSAGIASFSWPADETSRIACSEKLLWIGAAALTAHFLRNGELDVEDSVRRLGAAVAASGCGRVGSVNNFFEFHESVPLI